MPTPLTQESIPNLHRSPDTPDASGVYNASGTHNAYPVKAAEKANPQEDSVMEDTPYIEVVIAST